MRGQRRDRLAGRPAGRRHPLEVGRDEPHPVTGRVEATHAVGARLRGPGRRPSFAGAHGQDPGGRQHRHEVGLVERADPGQEITEVLGHPGGVAAEVCGRTVGRPSALACHPAGKREVVVGDDGRHPVVEAELHHPAVVVKGGPGEVAGLRLDAGPLKGEPVRGESQLREAS